jgi:hypothetical protein
MRGNRALLLATITVTIHFYRLVPTIRMETAEAPSGRPIVPTSPNGGWFRQTDAVRTLWTFEATPEERTHSFVSWWASKQGFQTRDRAGCQVAVASGHSVDTVFCSDHFEVS